MVPAESLSADEEPALRSGFWLIVCSHFASTLGISIFALFPKYLLTSRGMSQAEIGSSTMGLPLGALLGSPLVAFAMSRYEKRAIVRASGLALALLTGLFTLGPSADALPLLSVLVGGAAMAIFNGGAALTAEVAPEAGMARALGLHGAAGMLGHALGPVLLEPLAARAGWTSAFALAASFALAGTLIPLPRGSVLPGRALPALDFARPLGVILLAAVCAGIMHNALWTSHQPLVLARGGNEVRGYFLGMSLGALCMRVFFGGLPDRLGRAKSALYALSLYIVTSIAMTWVQPATLFWLGLAHGVAHGVFYPAIAALATGKVPTRARGEALTILYAAFNVGATCASFGFARFGEMFGPAAVFPVAAAFGVMGWFVLVAQVRLGRAPSPQAS